MTFITSINSNLSTINQSSQLQYFSIILSPHFAGWLKYFMLPLVTNPQQTASKFRQSQNPEKLHPASV